MTDRSTGTPSPGRQALAALALVTTLLLAAVVIVILGRNLRGSLSPSSALR